MSKKYNGREEVEFPEELEKETALSGVTFPEFSDEPIASIPEPVVLPAREGFLTEEELLQLMEESITDNSALISLLTTYEALYPDTIWRATQLIATPGANAKQARKTTLGEWKINDWGKR